MSTNANIVGLLAEFDTPAAAMNAATRVREAGYTRWDVHTPFPVHGMDQAMGLKNSKVGWFTFVGGVTGFTFGYCMVAFMNRYDYPIVVGGKPLMSPFFPFPVCYELTILLGAFGTLFGMLFLNRLPKLYNPVLKNSRFVKGASDDKFIVVIDTSDPKYNEAETRRLLEAAGSKHLEPVLED